MRKRFPNSTSAKSMGRHLVRGGSVVFCPEALGSLHFIAERKCIQAHLAIHHQLELASAAAFESYQEQVSDMGRRLLGSGLRRITEMM